MTKVIKSPRERERETVVVWALFDDAESSYKNAIKKYFKNIDIKVYSIGINDVKFPKSHKFFYERIDLSLNNFNLINELKELPKPNVILASPPCESWSGADCGGRMVTKIDNEGNRYIHSAKYYEEYNKTCHPVKRRYFIQKERSRIIGESTVGGTIEIIKHFKPKVWVIENPKTSKMWDFQKYHWDFHGVMNDTYYSAYDLKFSAKPTIFKSNIKLNLKKERVKGNNDHMAKGSYSKRSSIPELLIKDIISQILQSEELK